MRIKYNVSGKYKIDIPPRLRAGEKVKFSGNQSKSIKLEGYGIRPIPSGTRVLSILRSHESIGDTVSILSAVQSAKRRGYEVHVHLPGLTRPLYWNHPDVDKLLGLDDEIEGFLVDLSHPCPCGVYEKVKGSDIDKSRNEIFILACGLEWTGERPRIYLTEKEKNIQVEDNAVGLVLRSAEIWKDYPHNEELVRELKKKGKVVYVFDEEEKLDGCVNIVGKDIRTVAAYLSKMEYVIGPDTGLMHLCDALDIRYIGLFGSMNGQLHLDKYSNSMEVIQGSCVMGKGPCMYQVCEDGDGTQPCMEDLSIDDILDSRKHRKTRYDVSIVCNGGLGNDLIWLNAAYKLKQTKYKSMSMVYYCRQYYDIFDELEWIDIECTGQSHNHEVIKNLHSSIIYDFRYVSKQLGQPCLYPDIWEDESNLARYLGKHSMVLFNSSLGIETNWYELPQINLPSVGKKFKLKEPYVVISNGTDTTQPRQTKSIDKDRLQEVCRRLYKLGYKIVEIGNDNRAYSGFSHSKNLIGQTSLKEAISIIKHSVKMITNEGGLAHASAWINKTSIVLFGPTPISFWGYPIHINISNALCRPCFYKKQNWSTFCSYGKICMDIEIDKILELFL